MRYLVNFTETETTVHAYATQDACDAAREAVSARGTTTFVETIADLMELDRDHLARIYNLLKIGDEPIVRSFKTRTDAADRAWDRMARVEPVQEAPTEAAVATATPASTVDVAATLTTETPAVTGAPPAPEPAQAAPKAPRTPKAAKEPKEPKPTHAHGKPAGDVGKTIRAGTASAAILTNMMTGLYTVQEIAVRANIPDTLISKKHETMRRIWGLWKFNGFGYSIDAAGRYLAIMPANLTAETAIK